MKKDIIIKYESHLGVIVPWLDEAIKQEMEKQGYGFVGSGFMFTSQIRDLQFRLKD